MYTTVPVPCSAVVCGDSIAAGVLFDEKSRRYTKDENGFVHTLQMEWNGSILNLGKFGNTIGRALPRLQRHLDKETPDLVFIELGGNDSDFNWKAIAAAPHAEHTPATPVEEFERLLGAAVEDLHAREIIPVLCTLPPVDVERYFKHICGDDTWMMEPLLEWLGNVTHIYWWHERYNAAILRVARQANAYWVDVRGAFLAYPDFPRFICADGIHPNHEGQALIARALEWELRIRRPDLLKTPDLVH